MQQLHNHEVMGFDTYQHHRPSIRNEMIAQRRQRSVPLTENMRVIFENKQTVRYQIEEVLYAQRCSCRDEVSAQIATYQHLLPSKNTLKATLMLEYPDEQQAGLMLSQLEGIESTVYLQINQQDRIWPVVNEDIDCQAIVSPVHYLNFVIPEAHTASLEASCQIKLGVAHQRLTLDARALSHPLQQSLQVELTG